MVNGTINQLTSAAMVDIKSHWKAYHKILKDLCLILLDTSKRGRALLHDLCCSERVWAGRVNCD